VGNNGLGAVEQRAQEIVDRAHEGFEIQTVDERALVVQETGGVDGDVDFADALGQLVDGLPGGDLVQTIHGKDLRGAAVRANAFGRGVEPGTIARAEIDAGSLPDEYPGHGRADRTAAAHDDDAFSIQ